MNKSIHAIYKDIDLKKNTIFEENEIASLPIPVKRYLRLSNIIGKNKIKTVRLKQKGLFNVNGKKWTKMTAEQYFNVDSKEFVWIAKAGIISVVDQIVEDIGSLKVKLFRLIKVGEAKGNEIDQGENLRFLSEIIWFPSAFTNPYLVWDEIDDITSQATITYGNNKATAKFHFKSNGEIEKITAKRFREIKGNYELNDWEISNLKYKEFNSIIIPYKANVIWKLDTGDLCYYKFKITDIINNEITSY